MEPNPEAVAAAVAGGLAIVFLIWAVRASASASMRREEVRQLRTAMADRDWTINELRRRLAAISAGLGGLEGGIADLERSAARGPNQLRLSPDGRLLEVPQ
ncbi:MAG: hypothetical protein FJ290_19460 [Planctomycetes bacterium]|nr:hypothetical protein [Planctomycetota bacterium]